jgi:hypothetical protein
MRYAIVLGSLLGIVNVARAGQLPGIPLSDVPDKVLQAAQQALPDVDWIIAFKDRVSWYRVGGRDNDGHLVAFNADRNGNQGYYRMEIRRDELPTAVHSALEARVPDFQPKRFQACGRIANKIVAYRFEGEGLDQKHDCVYVTPNGGKVILEND